MWPWPIKVAFLELKVGVKLTKAEKGQFSSSLVVLTGYMYMYMYVYSAILYKNACMLMVIVIIIVHVWNYMYTLRSVTRNSGKGG